MNPPASPYVGAEPLGRDNKIFGRDREIRDLYFLLSKERIALLYSPSGAGKSSILYAREGLLDQFAGDFEVLPVTRVNTETKLSGVNRYALSMLLGLERNAKAPRKESELAALSLRDAVMQRPSRDGGLTLVVVDQFEEIVRIDPTDIDGKRDFFRQLGELLAEPTIWALLVLREDFLATLDPYIRQLPTHLKNRFRIDLLKPEEAAKAISGPAEGLARAWDPGAAEKLARNLAAETGVVEPMHLQIVCQDIWTGMRDDDMRIDPEDVTAFGDVDKVLGRFYARITADAASLGHNNEREIRNWVGSKLVVKGGVRGQVLAAEAQLHENTIAVLDKAHLIRREPRRGADWLELAHDRLVPAVTKNNAAWFAENLSDLERRAEQWDIGGRSEDLLAVGSAFRAMRAWAAEHPHRVKEAEESFLKESRKKAARVMWVRVARGAIVLAAIASWVGMGVLNEARLQALKAQEDAIEAAFSAVVAELGALKAEEDALGDKQVAQRAGLRARYSRATLYDSLAERALERKDFPETWLYTIGALAEEWPEGSTLPNAVARLLLPEIRPNKRWTEGQKNSAISALAGITGDTADMELRAVHPFVTGTLTWVSSKANQGTDGRVDYFRASDPNRTVRTPFFSFRKNTNGFGERFQGPFSIFFHDRLSDFVFGGDKFVFTNSSERRWKGVDSVSAIARSGDNIAVAGPTGTIRFLTKELDAIAGEPLRSGAANPTSLAFNPSGERLAAIGTIDGSVSVFRVTDRSLDKAAAIALRSGPVQSLGFVDARTVIAGTSDGRLHFLGSDGSSAWTLLQSVKVHSGGVVSLSWAPSQGEIVSGGSDGTIRRMPLTWEAFGIKVSILDVFRRPRDPLHVALYGRLRQASELILHHRLTDTRLELAGSPQSAADAERIYFGREAVALSYAIPGGEFVRKSAAEWTWQRDGFSTVLRVKSDDPHTLQLVDPDSGFLVSIPKPIWKDRRINFGGAVPWPAAVLTRGPEEIDGRIRYPESYLERAAIGWRIRTPEREEKDPHASLPDHSFAATLAEVSDAADSSLRLRALPENLTPASQALLIDEALQKGRFRGESLLSVPRAGGMAEWGGEKKLKLFRVTRGEGPGSRSEHTSGQRSTVYEAVSINKQGPAYRAARGEPLTLEFRWRVEISDRTIGTNCPGCGVQMYVGMKGATREIVRNEAIRRSFLKCMISDSMPPANYPGSSGRVSVEFKAPAEPGLYYITHLQAWDNGCDPITAKFGRFSTSPKDAVAVVRVE